MKYPKSAMTLTITPITYRRYLLGQQGLWPGRRWRGIDGAAQALNSASVVQIDPLNVAARSQDIALYGRVLDYTPPLLNELLYNRRQGFDWGGTVYLHPMQELPYFRTVMERKMRQPRRAAFAAEHGAVIETVRAVITERGPLGGRDFTGKRLAQWSYRSQKDTGQALYHLWIGGELMTHSRRGFERLYDLRSRVAPPEWDTAASPEEADDYFARRVLLEGGLLHARSFRGWFSGTIERPVDTAEAGARLEAMLAKGEIAAVQLEGEPVTPRYLPAAQMPVLEDLHARKIPDAWQPLETTTEEEMVLLAPLEIVSARGRARPVFGFEYLWEVYKPAALRRWGYYTLPVLYGDRLVARLDPKVDRLTGALHILGFWLEQGVSVDERFKHALAAGLQRFLRLAGAETLVCDVPVPLAGH